MLNSISTRVRRHTSSPKVPGHLQRRHLRGGHQQEEKHRVENQQLADKSASFHIPQPGLQVVQVAALLFFPRLLVQRDSLHGEDADADDGRDYVD